MYVAALIALFVAGFAVYHHFRRRRSRDTGGSANDSTKMLGEIILIEFFSRNPTASSNEWLQHWESVNIGRELLGRGFIKFFSTPLKINARVRKALIKTMIELEKSGAPKGPNFDSRLKELLLIDSRDSKI